MDEAKVMCAVCNRETREHENGRLVCVTCEKFVEFCVCTQPGGKGWRD
jgi:hypothetical protein